MKSTTFGTEEEAPQLARIAISKTRTKREEKSHYHSEKRFTARHHLGYIAPSLGWHKGGAKAYQVFDCGLAY